MLDFLLWERYVDYWPWLYQKKLAEGWPEFKEYWKTVTWGPARGWKSRCEEGPFVERTSESDVVGGW